MHSPVLYVTKPGIYRCTITDKQKKTCYSKSICVSEEGSGSIHIGDSLPLPPHVDLTGASGSSKSPHEVKLPDPSGDTFLASARKFSSREIEESTTSFNDLIGKGAFGKVYRGIYHGTAIAVKVLNEDVSEKGMSLSREVTTLTSEYPDCLVYPYMPNLSLYHCLHQYKVENPLSWSQRIDIMSGTAKGLAYLHSSNPSFLHQDVKSQNILLDVGFTPKLADFGFVTPLPDNVGSTSLLTVAGTVGLAGTRGYLPPEFADGKRGVRSDVYSYGIVCLETYTGLLVYSETREECKLIDHCKEELNMWADKQRFKLCADGKPDAPPDHVVIAFFEVSQKCTPNSYKKRCNMDEVIRIWTSCRDHNNQMDQDNQN